MSEYIVSARKYRPDSFGSLIGQDTIAQTLKNSILRNQLAHAYLFCGPRGVGKTSAARFSPRSSTAPILPRIWSPAANASPAAALPKDVPTAFTSLMPPPTTESRTSGRWWIRCRYRLR